MKCKLCNVDKLSREFPSETLTDDCKHPPFYCLRCVTKEAKASGKCPYKDCHLLVPEDSRRLKEFDELLDFLFPPLDAPAVELQTDLPCDLDSGGQLVLHVAMLTGDTETLQLQPTATVMQLKKRIRERTKVETSHQRLVYKENELETHAPDGSEYKLRDYDVKAFSTIHLMVLLYAIPESFNHVIFDLSWRYPQSGRDFLDACCLLFMKDVWYMYIDWRQKDLTDQVWHSGDELNDQLRTGHQRLEAKLKNIPKCVSHLVFTLSSFRSPSISRFPEPTLRFYDATDTSKELPHATFTHDLQCEALVLCCVSRTKDNKWLIYKGGQQSAGNTIRYWPMVETVKHLINSNIFPGESLAPGKTLLHTMTDQEYRRFRRKCDNR